MQDLQVKVEHELEAEMAALAASKETGQLALEPIMIAAVLLCILLATLATMVLCIIECWNTAADRLADCCSAACRRCRRDRDIEAGESDGLLQQGQSLSDGDKQRRCVKKSATVVTTLAGWRKGVVKRSGPSAGTVHAQPKPASSSPSGGSPPASAPPAHAQGNSSPTVATGSLPSRSAAEGNARLSSIDAAASSPSEVGSRCGRSSPPEHGSLRSAVGLIDVRTGDTPTDKATMDSSSSLHTGPPPPLAASAFPETLIKSNMAARQEELRRYRKASAPHSRRLSQMLDEQKEALSSAASEGVVEERRLVRVNTFNKSLKQLWESSWKDVQVDTLVVAISGAGGAAGNGTAVASGAETRATSSAPQQPLAGGAPSSNLLPSCAGPSAAGAPSPSKRDSKWEALVGTSTSMSLVSGLQGIFEGHFPPLFDAYLFYAKVDLADAADAAAAELYTMTEFKWRAFLKDATIVGEGKGQLTLMAASNIFTTVNLRRDNAEKRRTQGCARGANSAVGMRTNITDAVVKGNAQQVGPEDSAQTSVYVGGSVHGFTFSEFLEGLVIAALELPPPPGMPRPAGRVSVEYVLAAVVALLKQRVLPHAKKADVLKFRRTLHESAVLAESLEAIKKDVDPIYNRVVFAPKKLGTGKVVPPAIGFSLKAFLSMCEDAQLIGAQAIGKQLSRVQIKTIFLSSLEISGASAYTRRPLLSRTEFDEALLRLAYSYDASAELLSTPQAVGRISPRVTGASPRRGAPPTGAASGYQSTSSVSNIHRGLQGRSVLPQDGDARAAQLAQSVAGKLTPRGTPTAVDQSEVEAAILARLPLVCGRLLATFEQASFQSATIASKKV